MTQTAQSDELPTAAQEDYQAIPSLAALQEELNAQPAVQNRQQTPKPMISQEIRTCFIQHVLLRPNQSILSAAVTFGLAKSTAYDIMRRYEETGSMTPKKKGGITTMKMRPEIVQELESHRYKCRSHSEGNEESPARDTWGICSSKNHF
jgi:hypothetical protein